MEIKRLWKSRVKISAKISVKELCDFSTSYPLNQDTDQVNFKNTFLLSFCPVLAICISVNLFMEYISRCSDVYFCC